MFTACSGNSSNADKETSASGGQKEQSAESIQSKKVSESARESSESGKASSAQKEKYTEKAQNVIALFNEKKSDEIRELSDRTLKNALTDDKLSEVYAQLKESGEFEEFLENDMAEVEQNGQTFTVVVQQAKYEKNTLTYTLSFDKDEKLAGIFYK